MRQTFTRMLGLRNKPQRGTHLYDDAEDDEYPDPCSCWCEMCGCHGDCYDDEDDEEGEIE